MGRVIEALSVLRRKLPDATLTVYVDTQTWCEFLFETARLQRYPTSETRFGGYSYEGINIRRDYYNNFNFEDDD